ncbi:shikimate dehydrogenase [Phycicoccus sp. Soil748]|uniref:shikimate dehydrogenase n=1 Tax=Intrasporangiaceae TaxID=85021 RepID=UPI001F478E5E|nr:shikimate dehydrogenase [Phycicoccus sp. Soil748]
MPRPRRPVLNAAVLGRPVAHSLSPVLHSAAYRALGMDDWAYGAHDLGAAELAAWVGERDESWRGLSLTMPLKDVALTLADTASATARLTGAANTLVRRDDLGWDAHNTDVAGIVGALAHVDHDGTATLLGSGATARSAGAALVRLGMREVRVAARNPSSAADVVALLQGLGTEAVAVPLEQWAAVPATVVVSTLPPAVGAAVAALSEPADATGRGATLLDVVYADWPTELARAASGAGYDVVSGLDMLVHQAAEQFRLFTGRDAPVEAMFAAGRAALAADDRLDGAAHGDGTAR